MKDAGNRIKTETGKLDTYIVLLLVNSNNYQKAAMDVIRYLSREERLPGVYVSVNKPYNAVKNTLLSEKVDVDTIIFIDAITRISGGKIDRNDRCLYLEGPDNLTDFSISINEAVTALDVNKKFLFFDSINTLLVYNNAETVLKFFHFMTGRIRQWNVKGVIMALDKKTDKELISQIGQFCDKIVEV